MSDTPSKPGTTAAEIMRMAKELGERRNATEMGSPFIPPPKADRTNDLIAASLAGGIIAAGGKPVTAEEAVGAYQAVREALKEG